ncbi:tetratricopeptide repeat protein [Albidovulum sp.]|uniref:tetratricopeptide repeat protein n=1 Tax=Albidovulum sp. TaxID=1872424 RepID=UPI001E09F8D5|nr:tetratricopeptide repeat protein [Paracoccaceae bacterium]MCC0047312.1 tetratricopeptide repeat protein [Defluviimonas sp.]HPE26943.1 tetratricopeptide repeat protein [Albidovulum sp.]MCB2121395.1 tetratricopeptide repeat protein [Paracoccaceae bacterium]MCB2140536.1 tetratricopeptide repeat protein [Paracoccaceae bacterium]
MSETDSFIEEVTEEVRRDRLFKLMRKYGWIGILAVVLIVGGAAWNEWRKASARAEAEAFGDAILAAMAADDSGARAAALAGVPVAADGQSALLSLLAADEALAAGQDAAAQDALAAVASDAAAPDVFRQLAKLKLLILRGPSMDAAERDRGLAELAAPGAAFRPLAMEQQAQALADAGKTDEAIALFTQITEEAGVPSGLRQRATQMIVVLGGEPAGQ